MNELALNSATGYRESNPDSDYAFNSRRKQEFLELARDIIENHHEYPNVGDLCRVIGISVRTFQNHCASDAKFGEDWRELELKGEATCLSDMYALRKKNPMYMFGWLRARLPEKYDTSRKIEINGDLSWLKKALEATKPQVIATDAVITSTQQ
jgi:hypothetical protein